MEVIEKIVDNAEGCEKEKENISEFLKMVDAFLAEHKEFAVIGNIYCTNNDISSTFVHGECSRNEIKDAMITLIHTIPKLVGVEDTVKVFRVPSNCADGTCAEGNC